MAHTFYATHDNTSGFACVDQENNLVSLATATRATITVGTLTLDSAIDLDVIKIRQETAEWANTSQSIWVLRFWLGLAANIAAGKYRARVVIYSPEWPNGLVITNKLSVVIIA